VIPPVHADRVVTTTTRPAVRSSVPISANQCQSFIPPEQADRVVTTTTRPAVFAVSVLMARVEPALKPYHPSHRIKVPSTCMQ
jgi:hypothetical protein